MYRQDDRLQALRKLCRRALLINLGTVLTAVIMVIILLAAHIAPLSPVRLAITAALSAALAVVEYTVERALFKRGLNAALVTGLCLIGTLILGGLLMGASMLGIAGYICFRPLPPLFSLLRDRGRLTEGNPCEAVGRMKKGSRRESSDALLGMNTYLLFEDELTHETHLLRAVGLSHRRRYRVLYLPHSGLAAGEAIPDELQIDPFGNPVEAPVAPLREPTEKAPADSVNRQKAARYGVFGRICRILTYILIGILFISSLATSGDDTSSPASILLAFPPLIACTLLGTFFKNRELKLRCTARTTAICVDTVRRHSGKHSHHYPIVEFEANGVTYTAELTVSCSHDAVGQLYSFYYDPLEPTVVRGGWRE